MDYRNETLRTAVEEIVQDAITRIVYGDTSVGK
jgi:hypothetical protein